MPVMFLPSSGFSASFITGRPVFRSKYLIEVWVSYLSAE